MSRDYPLFDDAPDPAVAAANAAEFDRADAEREPPSVTTPTAPDAREEQVRWKLSAPPYLLGSNTVDEWLEKHSATHILSCIERMERMERDGKVIGRKIGYLEAMLTDVKAQGRRGGGGKRAAGPGEDTAPCSKREQQVAEECDGSRTVRRVVVEDGVTREFRVPNDQAYGRDVLRGLALATRIATQPDHPDQDEWVREWQNLP